MNPATGPRSSSPACRQHSRSGSGTKTRLPSMCTTQALQRPTSQPSFVQVSLSCSRNNPKQRRILGCVHAYRPAIRLEADGHLRSSRADTLVRSLFPRNSPREHANKSFLPLDRAASARNAPRLCWFHARANFFEGPRHGSPAFCKFLSDISTEVGPPTRI
jgi:hypothetical protein